MPLFTSTTQRVVTPTVPRIYINGQRRTDCWCETVTLTETLTPGHAELTWPLADYNSQPALAGDFLEIYGQDLATPLFRGHLSDPIEDQSEQGDVIKMTALDVRARLNAVPAPRDFNLPAPVRDSAADKYLEGEDGAGITSREIIRKLVIAYNAEATLHPNPVTLQFRTNTVPNEAVGTIQCQGKPIDQAIMQVLEELDGNLGIALRYSGSSNIIECFSFESSDFQMPTEKAYVVRATEISASPLEQPNGVANALPTKRVHFSQVTNKVTVTGAQRVIETLVCVHQTGTRDGRLWNTSIESAVVAQPAKYTEQGTDDEPNPDYLAEAADVGRKFKMPKVLLSTTNDPNDTTTVLTRPKLQSSLIQHDPFHPTERLQPFALVKWPGSSQWAIYLSDKFSISDDGTVIFDEMLATQISGSWVLPSEVWIEVAYTDTRPLSYTTDVQGPADDEVVRHQMVTKEEFKWERAYQAYQLQTSGGHIIEPSGSLTLVTADIINDDSSDPALRTSPTRLRTYAQRLARQGAEPRLSIDYRLPYGETGYRIGQRVIDNGEDTQTNITRVTLNFGPNDNPTFETSITAEKR